MLMELSIHGLERGVSNLSANTKACNKGNSV